MCLISYDVSHCSQAVPGAKPQLTSLKRLLSYPGDVHLRIVWYMMFGIKTYLSWFGSLFHNFRCVIKKCTRALSEDRQLLLKGIFICFGVTM